VDPYAWPWNPEALVIFPGLATAYFLYGLRRYGPAPWWRIASFSAAMTMLLVVSVTPLHTLAVERLLVVHLLQNVVLAEWAPLLVVIGLTPAMAERLVAWLPGARTLTHPAVALPLWLVNYAFWHVPAVYDAALRSPHGLLHLEHALYFVTGLLMWWPVVQDAPHRLPSAGRAAYTFAAFVLGSPIGLLLALVPEPVYEFYEQAPRTWGLTALSDQQLAGGAMAFEQGVVFGAVFAFWFARFLAEQDRQDADAPT
jgi:cytochrome c oxidase assembly factor CtaG